MATRTEPDLSQLPLDDLNAALRLHAATPDQSVLDRREIGERQADRIARRPAGGVGSRAVPPLRRGRWT